MELEARALERMERAYADVFRRAATGPGLDVVDEPGVIRTISAVPSPWFNMVLSSQLPEADMAGAVERLVGLYAERGLPLLWRLGPGTTGSDVLRRHLRDAGFVKSAGSTAILGNIPRLVHLFDYLPLGVRGAPVTDLAAYGRWFGVFGETFGVPSELEAFFAASVTFGPDDAVQNLVLERGGTVVACCTTVWSPEEPFASIFNFAVAPSFRRRGMGKYMLAYAALQLRRRGCPAIGQFSTPDGAPFYLRVADARVLGRFENWMRGPT